MREDSLPVHTRPAFIYMYNIIYTHTHIYINMKYIGIYLNAGSHLAKDGVAAYFLCSRSKTDASREALQRHFFFPSTRFIFASFFPPCQVVTALRRHYKLCGRPVMRMRQSSLSRLLDFVGKAMRFSSPYLNIVNKVFNGDGGVVWCKCKKL